MLYIAVVMKVKSSWLLACRLFWAHHAKRWLSCRINIRQRTRFGHIILESFGHENHYKHGAVTCCPIQELTAIICASCCSDCCTTYKYLRI